MSGTTKIHEWTLPSGWETLPGVTHQMDFLDTQCLNKPVDMPDDCIHRVVRVASRIIRITLTQLVDRIHMEV